MSGDDFENWMWAEAVRRQEQADRLRRQFVRSIKTKPRSQWEPPVDIFETQRDIQVIVALPGVSGDNLTDLAVAGNVLYVAGHRHVPTPDDDALLHRLEIPHGHFERHIKLPRPRLAISHHELVDGCLYLTLSKR